MSAGRIKLLQARVNSIFAQMQGIFDLSCRINDGNTLFFITKAKRVPELRKDFVELCTELEQVKLEADETKAYEPSFQKIEAFDDLADQVTTRLNDILAKVIEEKKTESARNEPPLQANSNPDVGLKIKLEPLKIPDFDGSPGNWLPFYQTFKRLVHENAQFSDLQRVAYLTSHLVGSAKSITKGIAPTEENYRILLDTLVARYQDVRALGSYYLDQIMDFKSLPSESESNLNRFLENFVEPVLAFKSFEEITDPFDFFLVYLAGKKLDPSTIRHFDMANRGTPVPTFNNLRDFVREQAKILARNKRPINSTPTQPSTKKTHALLAQQPQPLYEDKMSFGSKNCKFCKTSPHQLYLCEKFKSLAPRDRFNYAKSHQRCFNCLSDQHQSAKCKSNAVCGTCKNRHHSLLHLGQGSNGPPTSDQVAAPTHVLDVAAPISPPARSPSLSQPVGHTTAAMSSFCGHTLVLLSTAQVIARRPSGGNISLRALLDGGSQSHFIRRASCEQLGLTTRPVRSVVRGLGNGCTAVQEEASVTFYSRTQPGISYTINALVLDELTDKMPSMPVRLDLLPHITSLPLADQEFHVPGTIDLLIGAALWPVIVGAQKIEGPPHTPTALESSLGWLVIGPVPAGMPHLETTSCHVAVKEEDPIKHLLEKFWEIEEIPTGQNVKTPEDVECERIFRRSTVRLPNGRYMVALPFSDPPALLGNSLDHATKRYLSLERRFARSPEYHEMYKEVMNSYLERGYMSRVPSDELDRPDSCFYLPHHGVLKPGSTSTPLRVVMNASAKSSSGYSLNDILHTGEKLQADMVRILLNFRLFEIALSADIRQMYLRVLVQPCDRRFQRFLWRDSPTEDIQVYQMNTVVFGMSASPFLAQRCIRLLIEHDGEQYPWAAPIASRDLYMDDLLCSISSEQEASLTRKELSDLFAAGSFQLTKWCSNSEWVMSQVPAIDQSVEYRTFDEGSSLKILGLRWNPRADTFSIVVNPPPTECTKRSMSSAIAHIYDPLGLLAPITIVAKGFLKSLWRDKLDWDSAPPQNIQNRWRTFTQELGLLKQWSIPRHSFLGRGVVTSLIGFADASESAYGAVLYTRVVRPDGEILTNLLCSRSKVAPLQTVSIPRLELCAAWMLSKLTKYVIDTYEDRHSFDSVHLFSDSTVALQWIAASPTRWKVYVANRVTKIQENVETEWWSHVPGQFNPADCLSRGLAPRAFLDHKLWFRGPEWLANDVTKWPVTHISQLNSSGPPLEEKITSLVSIAAPTPDWVFMSLLDRVSTYRKLIRATAYALRFVRLTDTRTGPLRLSELDIAENCWLKYIQQKHFSEIFLYLGSGKPGQRRRPRRKNGLIGKLDLFVKDGLIRVGGRLQYSNLPYEQRHPLLLPKKEPFVHLLIDQYHRDNLHTGPHLLLSLLNLRYWILAARDLVRQRVHKCNTCFKVKPKPLEPKMAPLPAHRFQELKAFAHCGVDYAGPFSIVMSRRRGARSQKAYLCLFVCLSTKALHLELASDLSTECFLAAFRRFLSRRGPCSLICSDQGTNFVGAKNVLNELYPLIVSHSFNNAVTEELARRKIEWRLNPPSAPHFGGIWEANVKCVKTHLKRIIGTHLFTYEEMITTLTQIEALLNSRPLSVLHNDPHGPTALTPAHFLTLGPPLDHLPSADVSYLPFNRLDQYQKIDWVVQSFWKRWRQEYLHTLQARDTWTEETPPMKKGTVVVIMKDNAPPLSWPLAVVEDVYFGKDGVNRVALLKTASGGMVRPLVKLCPLPTQ